jgi:hypothetical protein
MYHCWLRRESLLQYVSNVNLETHTIIHLRDIIWLHNTYKDWVIDRSRTSVSNENDVIELPTGIDIRQVYDDKDNVEVMDGNIVKKNKKVLRELKTLESWFNPQLSQAIEIFKEEQEVFLEKVNLVLFSTSKVHELQYADCKE